MANDDRNRDRRAGADWGEWGRADARDDRYPRDRSGLGGGHDPYRNAGSRDDDRSGQGREDRYGRDRDLTGRGGFTDRGYATPDYGMNRSGSERGGYGGERGRERSGEGYGRDEERGFLDRAGDEMASWFGDEEAERRRRMDARQGDQGAQHHRGRGPKGYQRSDERIREEVNERLTDDPYVDASDIEVDVSNREVTLSGTVDSRQARRRAEDLVEAISGVGHVQNNLRVRGSGGGMGQGSGYGSGQGSSGGGGSMASGTTTGAASPDSPNEAGSPGRTTGSILP